MSLYKYVEGWQKISYSNLNIYVFCKYKCAPFINIEGEEV